MESLGTTICKVELGLVASANTQSARPSVPEVFKKHLSNVNDFIVEKEYFNNDNILYLYLMHAQNLH